MERTDRDAVLWLRRGTTAEARRSQQTALSRLEDSAARSDLDVDVRAWSKTVETTAEGSRVDGAAAAIDAYRRYSLWASEAGVSLEPAFQRYHDECTFTGASSEKVRLPAICLAIYADGRLDGVYPHARDDVVVTVADAIDRLEPTAPDSAVLLSS